MKEIDAEHLARTRVLADGWVCRIDEKARRRVAGHQRPWPGSKPRRLLVGERVRILTTSARAPGLPGQDANGSSRQGDIPSARIDCVVTGGPLALDGVRWLPVRPGFLSPVRALATLFRGRYLAGLRRACAPSPGWA